MAIILTILITLFFAFVIGMLVYLFIEIRWLGLSIYFMKFRIEGHPMLIMMVEDVLERLGKEENVPVFYKTYEELNKNETNEKEKAVGMYVHSASAEHQKKCDDALQEIRQMERDWRKPYNEICRLVGVESRLIEVSFVSSANATKRASAPRAAPATAYPFVVAFVVLPTASSASVTSRTFGGNLAISAIPPALSVMGP